MKLEALRKQIGKPFKLRPRPIRIWLPSTRLRSLDDDWYLESILNNPTRLRLVNHGPGLVVDLEAANLIGHDPPNFLLLRCQLILYNQPVGGRRVHIEPFLLPARRWPYRRKWGVV
jgi:hypothetical protein